MSVTRRLISGSASSWVRILMLLFIQIALVPVYLTYWSVAQFGLWVAIQALVNVLVIFDRGYTDYLGFEFLKIGKNSLEISKLLGPGLITLITLGAIECILLTASFAFIDFFSSQAIVWAVLLQWLSWIIFNYSGLLFRALVPFGYYPRMAWWNLVAAIVTSIVVLLVVIYGGQILEASIAMLLTNVIVFVIQLVDIQKLMKRYNVRLISLSVKNGFSHFIHSLLLSVKYFFEGFRHQGVRLLLTPLVGLTGVAVFTTMRTVSNVLLQGVTTVTNPVLPELMSFLNIKDQERADAAFNTIWLAIVVLLAPGALILQAVAAPLFPIWTKGQIEFNPTLLALLSLSVLIYALSQPRMSILMGHNKLKAQTILSVVSVLTLVVCCIILVPLIGITGAGWSLVVAEVVVLVGVKIFTDKWLQEKSLVWPVKASNLGILSVLNVAAGMFFIALFPQVAWLSLSVFFMSAMYIMWRFWQNMPQLMHTRIKLLLKRTPVAA